MKINLVYAADSKHPYRPRQPLGIAYIASILERAGYKVYLTDFQLVNSAQRVLERIKRIKPDVLGISTYTATFSIAEDIANRVSAHLRSAFVIFGGPHATALHKQILKSNEKVDAVVRGEGEYTTLELIERLEQGKKLSGVKGVTCREGKKIIVNANRPPIQDLDSLPFPARHLLPPLKAYQDMGSIVSSRGCPYHCGFCTVHQAYGEFGGSRWRGRSPKNVVDELEALMDLGANVISFVDDNFLVDKKRAAGIAKEIMKRGLELKYMIESRTDLVISCNDILPLLNKSGCIRIEIGVENSSLTALRRLNKQINPKQNAEAIYLTRKNNMVPIVNWIMFDAETTLKELLENLDFIERNKLEDHSEIFSSYLWCLPGTKIYKKYMRKGWIIQHGSEQPTYKIQDPDTRAVFATILEFSHKYFYRLSKDVSNLREIIHNIRLKQEKCSQREVERLKNLEEEAIELSIKMRVINYKVFKKIVKRQEQGKLNEAEKKLILNEAGLMIEKYENLLRKYFQK